MKVFIAIPTAGTIRTELLKFLLNIIHVPYHSIRIDTTVAGDICNNRNYLVNRFLQTDSDWLMFCDSDIIPPMNILDIIDEKKDIISPVNFTWKDTELIPLIMKIFKYGYQVDWVKIKSKSNLIKIDAVGLGCVFINRKVFEKLKKPYFEFKYDKDGLLINGEDFNFCDKVIKLGFNIWVDKRYMTSHFNVIDMKSINDFKASK